ncbi:hypothetical protein [Corynebacterium renale]|uniref:hypothetical protein n=1 Tax=Corynebacterium renale TaxID=1724 RepID=UPI000DFEE1DC|nr:hypothetical protein [Corynebacterium renale]STC99239.1 Lipoprotein LpqE [Corynebacterium renale]
MKPLKSAALIAVAAVSALGLSACSAGQVSQTATQVAAVDGAEKDSESGSIALRDVTVLVNPDGTSALKFVAINQEKGQDAKTHRLQSISVDGKPVTFDAVPPLKPTGTLVADSDEGIERHPQDEGAACTEYTATSLTNDDFAIGGNADVVFTFDSGTVEVTATIAAPTPVSGEFHREFDDRAAH